MFEGSGEIILPNGDVAVTATAKYMKLPIDQIVEGEFLEGEWIKVDDEEPVEYQLKEQLSKENQSAMASYNVRTQNAWYFRYMPWKIKGILMRIGYRFFGESNSSLTLTNLGLVRLPEELYPYVTDIRCWLTPRVSSPYGCTVLSFNNKLTLNMSRFCPVDELGEIFFRKIQELTAN